ncbi:hypothetical protein CLOP_g13808, partial [Closterium sp. NIES-67]
LEWAGDEEEGREGDGEEGKEGERGEGKEWASPKERSGYEGVAGSEEFPLVKVQGLKALMFDLVQTDGQHLVDVTLLLHPTPLQLAILKAFYSASVQPRLAQQQQQQQSLRHNINNINTSSSASSAEWQLSMIDLKIVGSLCVHPCAFAWKLNRGIRGMPQAMHAMRSFQPSALCASGRVGLEGQGALGGSPPKASSDKMGAGKGMNGEPQFLERNREALSAMWGAIERQQGAEVSPKLAAMVAIVRQAVRLGEKVVVFAEEHVHLDLVVGLLCHAMSWKRDEQVLRVDGNMTQGQRSDAFERFQKEKGPRSAVMVAAVRACGLGIDFTVASRVVMLDALWNPASDQQAISRVWRTGQQRRVHVYRLLVEGMGEMYKLRCAQAKQRLSHVIFHSAAGGALASAGTSSSPNLNDTCLADPILRHLLTLPSTNPQSNSTHTVSFGPPSSSPRFAQLHLSPDASQCHQPPPHTGVSATERSDNGSQLCGQHPLACLGGHSDCDGRRLICRVELQRNGVATTVHIES